MARTVLIHKSVFKNNPQIVILILINDLRDLFSVLRQKNKLYMIILYLILIIKISSITVPLMDKRLSPAQIPSCCAMLPCSICLILCPLSVLIKNIVLEFP